MKAIAEFLKETKYTGALVTVVTGVLVSTGALDIESASGLAGALLVILAAVFGSKKDTKSDLQKKGLL